MCWFGCVRKNKALCRHIACICIQHMSALFALNANEEKVSGASLQVINSHFLSPQVPTFLYNLKLSCVQKTKQKKQPINIFLSFFFAFSPSELYTFHLRHYRTFTQSICNIENSWQMSWKTVFGQKYGDRWGASGLGNWSSSCYHPCPRPDSSPPQFPKAYVRGAPKNKDPSPSLFQSPEFSSQEKHWQFRFSRLSFFVL